MTRQSIEDKVGHWLTAFNAIREELTPRADRVIAWNEQDAAARARHAANDRTAALTAALLVGAGGARPLPVDLIEDV